MADESEESQGFNSFNVCVLCTSDLKEKNAKLLPCLHTLCENCLNSLFQVQVQQKRPEEGADGSSENKNSTGGESCSILCPACNSTVEEQHVLDNMFVGASLTPITVEDEEEEKSESGAKEETPKCTGCEENLDATSFCTDCKEWLCDQCVYFHKRVKITKDHTIQPKEEAMEQVEKNIEPTPEKLTYCSVHKNEQLKLFCETCDKLTCRDCQLLEHKDHKYQFLTEAIVQQREQLQMAVLKLKQKRQNYQQADKILFSKNTELRTKLNDICESIRDVCAVVCKEMNSHADNLVNYLEKYISKKTTVIMDKKTNVEEALSKMKHAIDFVENALTVGDDSSILYTRGVMMKTLKLLSTAGIAFDPSILNYSITYENEKEFLLKNVYKAGTLVIDGTRYAGGSQTQQQHAPQGIAHQIPTQPVRGQSVPSNPHVRPPNRHVQQWQSHPVFQEKWKNLPLEQQNQLRKKMYERFLQQQRESQMSQGSTVTAPPPYGSPVAPNNPVNNSLQNLSNLISSSSGSGPHSTSATSTQPYSGHGSYPVSSTKTNNAVHASGTYYPPGERRMFNSNTPATPPTGMTSQLGVRPNMNSVPYPNVPRGTPPFQSGGVGVEGGYNNQRKPSDDFQQKRNSPTGQKSWNFHDMGNRFQPSTQPVERMSPAAHPPVQALNTTSPPGLNRSPGAPRPGNATVINLTDTSVPNHSPSGVIRSDTSRPLSAGSVETNSSQTKPNTTPTPPLTRTPPPLIRFDPVPKSTAPPSAPPPTQMGGSTGGKVMPTSNEDPNEDYCAVCQNGGDLLCCDFCPKVFHLKCHIPELKEFPIGNWQCALCANEDEVTLLEPEKKDFGVIGPGKRKAPSGLTEKEIKVCERILLELYCHKDSTIFHEPVSKAVPNYYKIITKPIDFSKIKSKLQRHHFNHFNSIEDFIADCKLVFKNCFTYNEAGTVIYKQGQVVEEEFERLVRKYLPCYVDCLTYEERKSETPLSDSSEGSNSEKKSKKKKYEEDPDVDPSQLVEVR